MKIPHFVIIKVILVLIMTACLAEPALSSSSGTQSGETQELTLSLAVSMAMQNNPLLRAAQYGREIADAQVEEAQAGRWPMLQFSETFTRSNNPVFAFGSLLEQGHFEPSNFDIISLNNPDPLNNFRTALNLRVPIFDQLASGTRIAQARIGQEQADHRNDLFRQQVRMEVVRTYYGVLVAQARKEVTAEAVKMSEADGKRIRDRFNTGIIVQSDLLAAEVQIADFRQQQIQAEGELVTAYAALNTALGLPVSTPQDISGVLAEKTFSVGDLEELLRSALFNRPDYSHAVSGVRSSEESVRGAWGQYLPRVDFFTSYGISGRDLSSGSSDYMVGAGLTYNIFDLGRSGKLDQARASQSMAIAEQEHLANQIRFEVMRAYQQFISAQGRVKVAGGTVDQAQEVLRIVQDRYQTGMTTITEVLRAQTTLVRTRLNLLAARYEKFIGYAQLLLSCGQLIDIQEFES
ncbi:MAG: TolC family protein [Syntrophales bacterium]